MKPGALLVNTARGRVVDHDALADALDESKGGTLGGYASDLWDPEPPSKFDALLSDDRVVVTPHIAALTDATYQEILLATGPFGGRCPHG